MCSGVSTARHSARGGAPEAGRPSVEDRPRGCVLLAAHPITGAVLFESPVVATGRKIQRSQGFWYAAVRGSREDDAVVAGGDRPPSLLAPVSLVARWADRASSPSKVTDEMMAATWVDFKQIKARSRSVQVLQRYGTVASNWWRTAGAVSVADPYVPTQPRQLFGQPLAQCVVLSIAVVHAGRWRASWRQHS